MGTSTMIQLPDNFVTNMMASASSLFTNFSGLITAIVGVLLGVVVIELIIGAIRHKS